MKVFKPVNRRSFFLYFLGLASVLFAGKINSRTPVSWDSIRKITMKGDLKAFWNIYTMDYKETQRQVSARGFDLSETINTYADYPGKQKESISVYLKDNTNNPWKKPSFFERIIKRNIALSTHLTPIFVHDIEFEFSRDLVKAWNDPKVRKDSNSLNFEDFSENYYKEYASWFYLPCKWSKEKYPQQSVGVYGPQVFNRDFWGFTKKLSELEKVHEHDLKLWKHIDPYVDFYISSNYIFYDFPDSVYYVAANIEQNYLRSRQFGNKPVYAFVWLKYHPSNQKSALQEIADYLVEALAIVPFFTGSKGVTLWGWEPKSPGPAFQKMPLFTDRLSEISALSDRISSAELIIDEPVHILWRAKKPLVRKLKVSQTEWIIMAVYPWQKAEDIKNVNVRCGDRVVQLEILGKHTEIYHLQNGELVRIRK
jgi:hypothetical protein